MQRCNNYYCYCVASLLLLLLLLLVQSSSVATASKESATKKLQMHEDDEADGHHDANFDQELLLGEEDASEFNGLQREAAEKKLAKLFDEAMDSDKDGRLTKQELVQWLAKIAEKQLLKEIDETWSLLGTKDDKLAWPVYAKKELPKGMSEKLRQIVAEKLLTEPLPNVDTKAFSEQDQISMKSYLEEMTKKHRRWTKVDADKDGQLTKEEFKHFLFPEEFPASRGIVADEDLERLDKNGDGRLSIEEFIADLWNPSPENEEKEPDWVQHERKDFKEKKDKNKDGFLDRSELEAMLADQDSGEKLYLKEANHLLEEADADKDGSLSRKELMDSFDLLASSAATNFGDHLREEL